MTTSDRLLTIAQVCELVQLNKRAIYRNIAKHGFPQPHRINQRVVRWSEAAVRAWVAAR